MHSTANLKLQKIKILREINQLNIIPCAQVHLFSTIDSTNQWLKTDDSFVNYDQTSELVLCCAETQTLGRGRFQRPWYSPAGENMYASFRMPMPCQPKECLGLSLVVSLAVLHTIYNILSEISDLKIKWPNDVLWHGKKLCGNLIETIRDPNGNMHLIIGIGLNINSITTKHKLDQPWCSLYEISNKFYDRNKIIAQVFSNVHADVIHLMHHGLQDFQNAWRKADYLYQKPITISHTLGMQHGIAMGINDLGQLILEDAQLNRHYLNSGETSLRELIF